MMPSSSDRGFHSHHSDVSSTMGDGPDAGGSESAFEVILVVEDDPLVRTLVEAILSKRGYHVLSANNATEAFAVFNERSGSIDLVLSDIEMPDMDGIQLSRELRQRYGFTRVVISSGHSSEDVAAAVDAHDLAGFILKPYRPASLLDEVKRALSQREG